MFKISLIGFVISIVLLLLINRFVLSWTGLVSGKLGLCEYKSIGVPASNGDNKKLSRLYNLPQIASVMRMNRSYAVNEHYNGDGLLISRFFNRVKYNIIFEDRQGVTEFNLNTYNFDGYPSGSVADGERCSAPSYLIERNVSRMIDDLPLDKFQKVELKSNVNVLSVTSGTLSF